MTLQIRHYLMCDYIRIRNVSNLGIGPPLFLYHVVIDTGGRRPYILVRCVIERRCYDSPMAPPRFILGRNDIRP